MDEKYPGYWDRTHRILKEMEEKDLEILEENGTVIIRAEDGSFEQKLPKLSQKTENLLKQISRPGEKRKDLAARLHIDAATLSRAISGTNPRPLTRNHILIIILNMDPIPTCEEVEHILMEMGHPGLSEEPIDEKVYQRNYLLRSILDYARENKVPLGVSDWAECANLILERLKGMKDYDLEMLYKFPMDHSAVLPGNMYTTLKEWLRKLTELEKEMPKDERTRASEQIINEQYTQYLERNNLNYYGGMQKANEFLAKESNVSEDQVKALRVNDKKNGHVVGREARISIASVMGATFTGVNKMLRMSNQRPLYPNQGDCKEVERIMKLMKNKKKRKSEKT